jgi:hypothetical protein
MVHGTPTFSREWLIVPQGVTTQNGVVGDSGNFKKRLDAEEAGD